MVTLAALIAALDLYYPALRAPFFFDDFFLPYPYRYADQQPLIAWLSGVRPFLLFTFWLNHKFSGESPTGYHIWNLLIHVLNTGLVFLVIHRLIERLGRMSARAVTAASVIGAAIFLVHPLQTESVSYVAGRSESLAALFMLLAYAVFLYRRSDRISWGESVVVVVLFVIAVASKENAAGLAGVLILTDVYWPKPCSTRGLRNNWRLYVTLLPGAAVAAWKVYQALATSKSAGFSATGVTWYQYGFTQARAIFTYLRLAVFPVGQSIDHDYAVSHTILEHGAIVYLAALVAITVFLVVRRERYPLACFGWLLTLALLAPTSSIIPIMDPLVERRMYLPLVGLILMGCEFARHLHWRPITAYAVSTAMVIAFALLCYQRNVLWAQPSQLWAAAALQSTGKSRPFANLVRQLAEEHRCGAAIPYLQHADQVLPGNYDIALSWSQVDQCLGRLDDAMHELQLALRSRPDSYTYRLVGLLYGQMGKRPEAGAALRQAVDLDPHSVEAHNSLALWYEWTDNLTAAEQQYETSLAIDPTDRSTRMRLERVRRKQAF
ncbi:MAG TPA: hypothetical protein VMT86_09225 [Bryobacteraceae bacterium]|nr:hypothetical protein [Bryobacteraceae bacterium]